MGVGNEEFGTIYRDYYPKLLSFIYNLTGNWSLTEDLTQEAFVKAFKEIDSVRDNSRLGVWLNRVAYNIFIDFRRKKVLDLIDKNSIEKFISIDHTPILQIEQKTMSECVQRKLLLLPETYRVSLYMDILGYSNNEIAMTMNCSLANVKIRLYRARKKIKEIFGNDCSFYYNDQNVLCCVQRNSSIQLQV